MKNLGSCCMVVLVLLLPSRAANDSSETDREKLIALENAWNQAQLHHDAQAVAQLLPETFVYTDYDGTLMNKAKFLADIKDPAYHPVSMSNDNLQVFPYHNIAIVIGRYHAKGTYKGKAFEHHGRFTDTWLFQDGKWLCVASHTNLIKQ